MTRLHNSKNAFQDHLVKTLEHPQALGSFRSWVRLLAGKRDINPVFLPRILVVSSFSLLTSPLRIYERLRYSKVLKGTRIHPSPIFIIGHWRTGTTYLHNLLCCDTRFGYLNNFQAMAPGFCLTGELLIKPILEWIVSRLYPTRMIDNIPLSMDMPQEEDYAISNLCPYSYLHSFSFPRQAKWFFERYVLLEGIPDWELEEFNDLYQLILKKASLKSGELPLVLKNPGICGRLGAILETFPQAKFIHLTRSPYDVYLSMEKMLKIVHPRSQLHHVHPDQVTENILHSYSRLMRKFICEKHLIPDGNLVEIRFEDLLVSPIDTLKGIYQSLDLPEFMVAESEIRAYVDSVSDYHMNQYKLTPEIIEHVNQNWGFAFDQWGYEKLEID